MNASIAKFAAATGKNFLLLKSKRLLVLTENDPIFPVRTSVLANSQVIDVQYRTRIHSQRIG
jgi:hypothetical protein